MRRIAYILSAYTDAPHLARLVAALDDGGADFYVHIDRKVDSHPFHRLLDGKVTFVPSHWISWGGWQQVEYQKELLAAVLHSGRDYMRVVCLSGQDYPLWSNGHIRRYFDEHPDTEFIMGLNLTHCTDRAQRSKICCYHFFRDLSWRNLWWKNKLIVASRLLMKTLPPPIAQTALYVYQWPKGRCLLRFRLLGRQPALCPIHLRGTLFRTTTGTLLPHQLCTQRTLHTDPCIQLALCPSCPSLRRWLSWSFETDSATLHRIRTCHQESDPRRPACPASFRQNVLPKGGEWCFGRAGEADRSRQTNLQIPVGLCIY